MKNPGIILSLCDRTGNMVRPWADAGWECWCVDLQHEPGIHREGNIVYVNRDVRYFEMERRIYRAFAFPPCTHLAGSGARWWRAKGLPALIEALQVVEACRAICDEAEGYSLENPVGRLSTLWRPADQTFDPCDYAGYLDDPSLEAYTKRTCLWIGGGFVMPPKRPVEPTLGSLMHLMGPSKDRADKRSVTPMGFARAVYEANQPKETPVCNSNS